YEGSARQVSLAFAKPAAQPLPLAESGHAHVQPFFNCPAADYPYNVYGWRVTQTVTATTRGIGLPTFQWRVNGKLLTGGGSGAPGDTVSAQVDVPDPQRPSLPQRQTETFIFDYEIEDIFDAAGGRSMLTLTNRGRHGDYRLDIQVEADETAVPTG